VLFMTVYACKAAAAPAAAAAARTALHVLSRCVAACALFTQVNTTTMFHLYNFVSVQLRVVGGASGARRSRGHTRPSSCRKHLRLIFSAKGPL
jgi:hypothetical protein